MQAASSDTSPRQFVIAGSGGPSQRAGHQSASGGGLCHMSSGIGVSYWIRRTSAEAQSSLVAAPLHYGSMGSTPQEAVVTSNQLATAYLQHGQCCELCQGCHQLQGDGSHSQLPQLCTVAQGPAGRTTRSEVLSNNSFRKKSWPSECEHVTNMLFW